MAKESSASSWKLETWKKMASKFTKKLQFAKISKRRTYNLLRIDYQRGGRSTQCRKFNEISLVQLSEHKRSFHVYHDDGFAPNQEPKRINMFRTAVGEECLFAFLEPFLRKVVSEETERAISKLCPASSNSSVSEAETTTAGSRLQLLFDGKLPDRIFTNNPLKAEGDKLLKIQLFDANSKTVVESGPLSSAKVEFVVISGLFSSDREDWTEEEFNSKILSEREGKRPLLAGPQGIVLKNGVGLISDLSITDNSSWIPNKKFILGARISSKNSGEQRVKPARSYPFSVKDSRGEGYTKRYPPRSQDEVWRLVKIRKDGKFHEQLALHKIFTVKDFLEMNEMNQPKLRHILDRMSDKIWRKVLDHAKTCIMYDCPVSRYPNGWNGPEPLKDLNQLIYLNRFHEQPASRLSLTYDYEQAGSSISPNPGLQLVEAGIIRSQEAVQIHAPNTNNSEEDGAPLMFQIQNNHADQGFPLTLQPDYTVTDYTSLSQTPNFYPPATLEYGHDHIPSPSYAAEFSFMDHVANILNGAD